MGLRSKNLQEQMNPDRIVGIPCSQVVTNPLNFYACPDGDIEQELVKQLAERLVEAGEQAEPGIVYEDGVIEVDGREKTRYVLISGERRLKAVKLNEETGVGDGIFKAKIIPKPEDQADEMMRIIQSNGIRKKDTGVRLQEVKKLDELYRLKKANKEKNLGRKREWIGSFIGLSPRQTQEYLKMLDDAKKPEEPEPEETDDTNTEIVEDEQVTIDDVLAEKEELKRKLKELSDAVSFISGLKISVRQNWSVVITPQTKDMDGVKEVFEQLGIQLEENHE